MRKKPSEVVVAPAQRIHVENCLPLYRGGLERAFSRKASPLGAIKAKCLDCCHWDRDEVAHCTVILCPLHAYRPFQEKKAATGRAAAVVSEGRRRA